MGKYFVLFWLFESYRGHIAMAFEIYLVALACVSCLALLRLYQYSKLSARPYLYPPGPAGLPFIGNLHQIPMGRSELKFQEYGAQFGAITGLKAGCQNLVVLNSWQVVRDLLEQRGSIYSSRPKIPVVELVTPGGLNPALNFYGDVWRAQRKKLVEFLGGERTENMKPVQDAESTQMIYDMLEHPEEHLEDHVERSFGAAILATGFGQRGKTLEKGGKIDRFFRVEAKWTAAAGPTASPPIGSFPLLASVPDWLTPWRGWKKIASEIKSEQQRLYGELLKETKERLLQGKGTECFMAQCIMTQEKEWYDDKYLSYLGGVLLEGGAETSASATIVFIMAMAAFPDVLAKAQKEVDELCGPDRMPGKDDTGRLPYMRAIMLELLRWRPVTPTAVPHQSTVEDTYNGYIIPNDSTIFMNTWAINHEESFYDAPNTFNPDRYLQNEFGSKSSVSPDAFKGRRMNYTFGAGRRVCPGQRFAENSMMMHFAKLAWAFEFVPTGKLDIETRENWIDGVVVRPKNLNVKLNLRDEGRRKTIKEAWVEADKFLQQFES
jgi:cytochrome P450